MHYFFINNKGPKGGQGMTGFPGKLGEPGLKGPSGKKGQIGFQGQQGTKGFPGPPGEKGESRAWFCMHVHAQYVIYILPWSYIWYVIIIIMIL